MLFDGTSLSLAKENVIMAVTYLVTLKGKFTFFSLWLTH